MDEGYLETMLSSIVFRLSSFLRAGSLLKLLKRGLHCFLTHSGGNIATGAFQYTANHVGVAPQPAGNGAGEIDGNQYAINIVHVAQNPVGFGYSAFAQRVQRKATQFAGGFGQAVKIGRRFYTERFRRRQRHNEAAALRLGVEDVRASVTPEGKLAAVTKAQHEGRCVAMVGDGINDAPVLARADVSLAMGQGALVSRSQADAVITSNRLGDLVRARDTARHAVRIVRQNFMWAGGYNAVSIPLALAGYLPPWAAGLGMATSSLVVVANALRAAR